MYGLGKATDCHCERALHNIFNIRASIFFIDIIASRTNGNFLDSLVRNIVGGKSHGGVEMLLYIILLDWLPNVKLSDKIFASRRAHP